MFREDIYKLSLSCLKKGVGISESVLEEVIVSCYDNLKYQEVDILSEEIVKSGWVVSDKFFRGGDNERFDYKLPFACCLCLNHIKIKREVPKNLVEVISSDSFLLTDVVFSCIHYGVKMSDEVFDLVVSVSGKDIFLAYYIYKACIVWGRDVPEDVLRIVSEVSSFSYGILESLLLSGHDVPERIVVSVSKDSSFAMRAYRLYCSYGKDVPKCIYDSVYGNVLYKDLLEKK